MNVINNKLDEEVCRRLNLEALGQMASGMAHNINNVLAAVTGQLELSLLEGVENDMPKHIIDRLETALQSCYNGSELCAGVLAFAGKGRTSISNIDVNVSCRRIVQLVQAGVGPGLRVESSLGASKACVLAPAGKLENAVLNLALNARDALLGGGIIHISTSNVFIESGRTNLYGFSPSRGMHIAITVSDTGSGMSEDVKKRLFEPFFTTKGDKGNGIGLFSVKEAVQQMNGFVEIVSAPKQGTQFVIYLPVSLIECFPGKNETIIKGRSVTERGNVLVIDDEEVILEVFRGMLSYLGYRVTVCSDPREALALYRHCWRDYEMVLFDMSMPHMSGIDCWNEIRSVNPLAKVIVTSGYGMMADIEKIIDKGNARFLEKPFQIKHLEEIIEKIAV